jgi:hypothetical protein
MLLMTARTERTGRRADAISKERIVEDVPEHGLACTAWTAAARW